MKLTTTLTEAQRAALQDSANHIAKLQKKLSALNKSRAALEETKTKALARLAAAEKAADGGDEEASVKVLGFKDQLMRLNLTFQRADEDLAEWREESAKAVFFAGNEVREAHRPLVESLIEEAGAFLTPWCASPGHARQLATGLIPVQQVGTFLRPKDFLPQYLVTGENVPAALESVGKTVDALLAGEPVMTQPDGTRGGIVLPSFC